MQQQQHALLLLAAGPSIRLGYPKQLLPYHAQTLLRHVVSEALKAIKNIVVVLGANAPVISKELAGLPVHALHNKDWEEGMASSIRCGLEYVLKENPAMETVIIMVADQPFVSAALLADLLKKQFETKQPIVACTYKDTVGTPVLFQQHFFSELLALKGQAGAKKIVIQHPDETATIPFPLGYIDIDTKEDYDDLQKFILSN